MVVDGLCCIQRRFDSSVNFDGVWMECDHGFGDW